MAKEKKFPNKEATISGFVAEIELANGETGLQLVDDEYQYQVVMDKQGAKLLDYVDEEVEVTGVVSKNKGVRELKVMRFHILDDDDDDDDDDDFFEDDDDDDFLSDRRAD